MDGIRLTPIPTPADAPDEQRSYAVLAGETYVGRVESHHPGRRWAAYRANGALVSDQFVRRREAAAALAAAAIRTRDAATECPDARRPHTAIYVTDTELAALQRLAAALGYYTRRGPHAKTRGSVTALATALAQAAEDDGPLTLTVLRRLFREGQRSV